MKIRNVCPLRYNLARSVITLPPHREGQKLYREEQKNLQYFAPPLAKTYSPPLGPNLQFDLPFFSDFLLWLVPRELSQYFLYKNVLTLGNLIQNKTSKSCSPLNLMVLGKRYPVFIIYIFSFFRNSAEFVQASPHCSSRGIDDDRGRLERVPENSSILFPDSNSVPSSSVPSPSSTSLHNIGK